MSILSRTEEIVLLAVLNLKDKAYGVSIQDFIRERTGMEWSLALIYDPLNKMAKKGLVRKFRGEPTPERGGRHKCLYEITIEGRAALLAVREIQDSVWAGVPKKTLV